MTDGTEGDVGCGHRLSELMASLGVELIQHRAGLKSPAQVHALPCQVRSQGQAWRTSTKTAMPASLSTSAESALPVFELKSSMRHQGLICSLQPENPDVCHPETGGRLSGSQCRRQALGSSLRSGRDEVEHSPREQPSSAEAVLPATAPRSHVQTQVL